MNASSAALKAPAYPARFCVEIELLWAGADYAPTVRGIDHDRHLMFARYP